jgi:hypothetical protein
MAYSLKDILDEIRDKRDIEIDIKDYSDPRTINQVLKTLYVHRSIIPYTGVQIMCKEYMTATGASTRRTIVDTDSISNFNGNIDDLNGTKATNMTSFAGLKSVLNDLPPCSCYARALWCTCNVRDACLVYGNIPQCESYMIGEGIGDIAIYDAGVYWCESRCVCNFRTSTCPGRCACNQRTGVTPLEKDICRCNQVHPAIVQAIEYQTNIAEPYAVGNNNQKTTYNYYKDMTCSCNVQHYFSNEGSVTGTIVPEVEGVLAQVGDEMKDYLTLLNAMNNNLPIVYK